ncbi:hypothetical protein M8C21_020126 [Ambrosia artemisiifolia]|uniref:J domain-containing protein n=1 Tax=Ambrosia artemisiifolia TaxID=4212 RepID=A0AAD5D828_AMBAR|nr:hypothetical protein M8C21_020126 [Ambrosia artemisiifolia]
MKTLSRCRNNIEADNVVLIDVDTYDFDNVIVIDIPESHTKKQGGSSDKTRPRTYIYIDDDDDDGDESPCDDNAGADLNGERNFENGASSSRRYGLENPSPVKLSKGKRTYSGRGFNRQSDSDSSDDDSPDCEFMEDFSGKLKEQWERASLKRKGVLHNDHASSSKPYTDANSEFGVNRNKKHDQDSNVNGTSDEQKDESPNFDATGVEGGKDDEPLGEMPYTSSEEENEKNDLETAATADDDVPVENSIIGQREKLKETDEYKRALEEELLARQKALQRQDLKRLEISCLDMASLLRGLGIEVGKGPVALPNEVRAAYKRALLSFHPDRASGSDMRQQVEAEEKFKLISRMKEKFSL